MAGTAAYLADRVFPRVPVRQWVLSFPHALRYRLAYDASLVTDVLGIFTKTIFAFLTRRAREFGATEQAQSGAVTFIQRFDSALGLNLHLHMLVIDGVYAADKEGRPHFQVLLAPETEEIQGLAGRLAERITKFLGRRGLGPESDPQESDPLSRDQPAMAAIYVASVLGRVALGPNAGRRVKRTGDQVDPETMEGLVSPRCASVSGFSLHANTAVHAEDRARLERLIGYCARPAVAIERLDALQDGRVRYRFKKPWRDGTTHVVFEPLEFLEKLAALVPAPKAHLVRYHGVLAPAARWRPYIVPSVTVSESAGVVAVPAIGSDSAFEAEQDTYLPPAPPCRRNYLWAELMKRAWDLDVLECPRCRARMRIIAAIRSESAAEKILISLGLPSRAPPVTPARRQLSAEVEPF